MFSIIVLVYVICTNINSLFLTSANFKCLNYLRFWQYRRNSRVSKVARPFCLRVADTKSKRDSVVVYFSIVTTPWFIIVRKFKSISNGHNQWLWLVFCDYNYISVNIVVSDKWLVSCDNHHEPFSAQWCRWPWLFGQRSQRFDSDPDPHPTFQNDVDPDPTLY